MKKFLALVMLIVVSLPGFAMAEVEAGAGSVTLNAHIDFVARYSEEDDDAGWEGYETYNLEFAVLGMSGKLGDNVGWTVNYAFAFAGPYAALMSLNPDMYTNDDAVGYLLDARIDWAMMDSLTLSAGRMLPPTSMTWAPHMMKALYTANYPLINGGGVSSYFGQGMLVPLPLYQTGVMLTAKMSGLSLMAGSFNGSDIAADGGPIMPIGLNNTMDIDKTKMGVYKLALDMSGMHLGGFYVGEEAGFDFAGDYYDSEIAQWGVEMAYNSDMLIFQGQYLNSTLDFKDDGMDEDLVQWGWYVLAGVGFGPVQIVSRYDYINYDDSDGEILSDDEDEEDAVLVGINYKINDNTTLGVDYTWRTVESESPDINELAVIIEANLF